MGNIKNFNFNKLDLKLSNSDYWDFFLATDETDGLPCSGVTSGDCFVVWYDFNNPSIYINSGTSATTIYSLVSWNGATNTGYTFSTIGLTGIDNGLITFNKTSGDTTNQALLSALTGTTLIIPSGDTRLVMNRITGTTGNFIYPIDIISNTGSTIGSYSNLCGGFYQGYYKIDGSTYQVLPVRENHAWSAEFWLNPQDLCSGYTGTTLNDLYPNNKGFFFYMGTRAENKFWNTFDGVDSGCTSACTQSSGCTDIVSEWCTIPKETNMTIIGDYGIGIPLNPPQIQIDLITNNFLIYGRATFNGSNGIQTSAYVTLGYVEPNYVVEYDYITGSIIFSTASTETIDNSCCRLCGHKHDALGTKNVCSYDGQGILVVNKTKTITNHTNPFLIYGRASKHGENSCNCQSCVGPNDGLGNETVCSFSGITSEQTTLDYKVDVIDNALGFRIKDDGSIGYRLLTVTGTCLTSSTKTTYVSGITVEESYSLSGAVSANTWSYVVIRFVMPYMTDCQLETAKPRKGKLMFYVNGKLKFVVNDFDEIVARRLNEYKLKQVGVPFNFSLGGGSQGLLESQTFDGLDMLDRGLPIETNFAGSFIGGISQFKFNICDLSFCDIQHNFEQDASRYNIIIPNHGYC